MNSNTEKIILSDWNFSLADNRASSNEIKKQKIKPGKWYSAQVPGTIHTDLLNNKLIDNPFYSDNELKLDWISRCDWIYNTEFILKEKRNYNLVINGIDTIADVYLNDKLILSCKNMFLSYKIDIEKFLRQGRNELKIYFHSPVNYSIKEENRHGKLPVALNSYRVYIRKAQYSFGWDWGPSFPTSGIWKNIILEEKREAEIENVLFTTKCIGLNYAVVKISASIKTKKTNSYKLFIRLQNSEVVIEKKVNITKSGNIAAEFEVANPNLWWPNGEGNQDLYNLSISIVDKENKIIDAVEKKAGIRTVELIQKEKNENTFKLRINGKDIFAKGVDWIPADSFLPRITNEKYLKLLTLAKDANMNMVRVWGGGIYENELFYNLCDELGLLVWQDFMFACGSYPEHEDFIQNVKEEVNQNVAKLQHHPSIAVWCGNNENEWIWFQEQKSSYKKMPGYKIYNKVIPDIIKSIDSTLCYWQSSPFGKETDPNSFNSGNTHQWEIWSRWIDYENVKHDQSLFVTEFGFQGPANKDTFEKYLPEENMNINDKVFEFHNKQVEGPERINRFLSGHLPLNTNWEDYLYLTQLNQGFALKTCLEHWRTNGRTNGSLIWQLNDCWPVTSWAIVDSELQPKLAYHFVKNIFARQIVFFSKRENYIEINLQNQNRKEFNGSLRINVIDVSTGESDKEINKEIVVKAKSKIIVDIISSEFFNGSKNFIVFASLLNNNGSLVNTNYYKEKPWKYFKSAEAKISLQISVKDSNKQVSVKTNKPAYFVDLYSPGIVFNNRGFTILPGEEIIINISGENVGKIKTNDIKIFSLNKYL